MNIKKELEDIFLKSLNETRTYLKTDNEFAFLEDKFTGVVRTRTTAELCLSMIKIQKLKIRNYEKIIQKMINWLIFKQNDDGSWNETHVNYDYPSSVFTAICASTLFEAHMEIGIKISVENLENAADFLIEQEISEGHFRKSEHYHADVLNADAMVSAFLIKFGYYKNNSKYIKAAKRGMKNILKQQKSNGEIPYGTNIVDQI